VRLAKDGRKVVRLKGGHPLVFARGGEEALALAAEGIPFRVLSGVTSAFGGLASAGIPATMRGVNGAVILATGFAAASDDRPDWAALARTGQPMVIYMGLTHMEATVADLLKGGLAEDTPAALVENATLPGERVVTATLGTLAEAAAREHVVSPALIVIGHIVPLREKFGR
jgi:uroporphyrin-III C-methyltransferase